MIRVRRWHRSLNVLLPRPFWHFRWYVCGLVDRHFMSKVFFKFSPGDSWVIARSWEGWLGSLTTRGPGHELAPGVYNRGCGSCCISRCRSRRLWNRWVSLGHYACDLGWTSIAVCNRWTIRSSHCGAGRRRPGMRRILVGGWHDFSVKVLKGSILCCRVGVHWCGWIPHDLD